MTQALEWQDFAACRFSDPELWFGVVDERYLPHPPRPELDRIEKAKTICRTCPVEAPCREYALGKPELYGVWGGKSSQELHHLRRGS